MADLARHRRLCRALHGPPLQRLGLLAISCSLLCSLLLEHPARYLILSPAPTLGGRRGLALVAEWARGAIVAARCVVEDAERFFTVVTERARVSIAAAALREENAAWSGGHALLELGLSRSPCDASRSSEHFHGLLMSRCRLPAVPIDR